MNDLLDDDDVSHAHNERELTLSTGAILGIFLTLVLLCGACFGVGYNMGRKSTPTPLALNDAANGEPIADSSPAKPAAGSPLDSSAAPAPVVAAPAPAPRPVVHKPAPAPTPTDDADTTLVAPRKAPATPATPSVPARTVAPSALMPGNSSSAAASPGQTGSFIVQVAAVSHQEDADLLVGALRARGYTVSARHAGSDSFIHVQVGPFANKKDADAMRQRLLADGYNAIVK